MNFRILLFIIFAILSFINIISIKKDNKLLIHYTKPLLMPTLLLFYLVSTALPRAPIIIALIFGFLGDVFLMYKGNFFIFGLFSFLLGHVSYSIEFIKNISILKTQINLTLLILFLYIILGMYMYKLLLPYIKLIKNQVLMYIVTIISMSFFSFIRRYNYSCYEFWFPFIGSILFISSDSMLAYNKFIKISKMRSMLVMTTYILAQLSIVIGFI